MRCGIGVLASGFLHHQTWSQPTPKWRSAIRLARSGVISTGPADGVDDDEVVARALAFS